MTGIVEGSPAEGAGLKEGDVITAIDGKEVRDEGSLLDVLAEHEAGQTVKVTYYRSGKKQDVEAVLAERKEEEHWKSMDWSWNDDGEPYTWNSGPRAYLGVNGGEDEQDGDGGALVAAVVEGSAAEKMGIKEDDRITAINGTRVLNFTTLAELVADLEPGAEVNVDVQRGSERLTLKGALGKRDELTWGMPPMAPICRPCRRCHRCLDRTGSL
ncbi:MAG: PDZ domain-containing protein [Flavobacteriales bacterium]|nr:PDZ domain-containing protein [Flavobacteriales bacterium]